MNVTELRAHIEDKIFTSEIQDYPFPHMVVERFFPEPIFRQIMEYNLFKNNSGVAWMKRSEDRNRNETPYEHRKQVNFHSNDRFKASPEAHEFWQDLKKAFLDDDWFAKLIFKRYPEYFKIRFPTIYGESDFYRNFRHEFFLQRHDVDYHIGPHTDVPPRVFTCIFSFAETEGFEEFGTQLLKHKNPRVCCSGMTHYEQWDDFDVVKTAEYKPNNFLLFFKTPFSFHAVKTITAEVPNERYGMQFQFYEANGGLFKDLSREKFIRSLK